LIVRLFFRLKKLFAADRTPFAIILQQWAVTVRRRRYRLADMISNRVVTTMNSKRITWWWKNEIDISYHIVDIDASTKLHGTTSKRVWSMNADLLI